jgi:UDP-N-acetylglucosamine acyltransferase
MPIHPSAIVDRLAEIDPSAVIGPHVVIEGPVQIAAECELGASAVVLGHTQIGRGCRIHAHAVVGGVPQDRRYDGGVSFCRVGEECTIREGATVHRGTAAGSATIIGNRCLLMTNSHVAHNCRLGDDVTLVSGSLLGGYVEVGGKAMISGHACVHQFVRIGELALVSILARVVQDVPPFLIAGRDGAIVGENRVGLLRAGLLAEEKQEIKAAYRVIYRAGLGRNAAIDYLSSSVKTAAGRRLLDFMSGDSPRGVATRSPNSARAA